MPRWTPEDLRAYELRKNREANPSHAIPAKAEVSAVTTDHDKLNKLEREFHRWLQANNYVHIHVQSITLKLGHDCRYTPDFVTVSPFGNIRFWETKGFFRDDAKVKITVAARMYRHMGEFWLVFKKDGEFQFEQVRP